MSTQRQKGSAAAIAQRSTWRHPETPERGLERYGFALLQGHEVPATINTIWHIVAAGVQPRHFWHLPEWYEHYVQALAQEKVLFFVAYYYQRPIGILPLCQRIRRVHGMQMRLLELPTHAHMPLSDLIIDTRFVPPDFFVRFDRFLLQQGIAWDILVLQNVPADSCVMRLLDAADVRHVATVSRRYDCIVSEGDYETLAQTYAGKTRENFRRARRRLAQAGLMEYISASSGQALTAAFAAFLEVEASGWKGADGVGTAIKLDDRLRRFYQGIMRAFEATGGCQINLLKLDGEAIAAQFCLVVDSTVYALKIGYDEAYAKFSPGKVLLDEMLRTALGARRQVNLTSHAQWHADWRPRVENSFQAVIFNRTPRARIAHALVQGNASSHSLYRRYIKRSIAWLRGALRVARRRVHVGGLRRGRSD
jgi:CelD/BcsL family acetyltransferase involved in cellulose biosynthesis